MGDPHQFAAVYKKAESLGSVPDTPNRTLILVGNASFWRDALTFQVGVAEMLRFYGNISYVSSGGKISWMQT